jgi:hypothetical protein
MKGQEHFRAKYSGKCRICGRGYRRGQWVWSVGIGHGANHHWCQPPVTVRKATKAEIIAVKRRANERRRGIYSS